MAIIPDKAILEVGATRYRDGALEAELTEHLAVEEPLEIRVAGDPVAVTLRTPGDDGRLAVGFLFAEGLISGADDLGTVSHCGRPGEEGYGNVIDCAPAPGANLDLERVEASKRGTLTTAACGVCGRRTVDDLHQHLGPLPDGPLLDARRLAGAVDRLDVVQRVFARTGGTHAAVALDKEGEVLFGFEDVGRHNAVDKVVGALVLGGLRAERASDASVLVVSGRAGFEIVQKAARARIPFLVSVSAASSLAVQLAQRLNLTLCTFTRRGGFTVLAGGERVHPAEDAR